MCVVVCRYLANIYVHLLLLSPSKLCFLELSFVSCFYKNPDTSVCDYSIILSCLPSLLRKDPGTEKRHVVNRFRMIIKPNIFTKPSTNIFI